MYHDDDLKGECFRKYPSPEHFYRDHSDFLRYRERYAFLFDLEITDYKAWAYGLKKAGYATDPAYPKKLIKLIEEYDLHQYDRKPASFGKSYNKKDDKTLPQKHVEEKPIEQKPLKEIPAQEQKIKEKKEV
jgi:flagellum-specific peptidoglycan hydrolase FlgJ